MTASPANPFETPRRKELVRELSKFTDEELVEFITLSREKRNSKFFRILGGHHAAEVVFQTGRYTDDFSQEITRDDLPLALANAVSSHDLSLAGPFHRPVIDLDVDALLIESSTPGHHHLIIDRRIPWDAYQRLLWALHEAGLVEKGFVESSVARKQSWIRTPWTRK